MNTNPTALWRVRAPVSGKIGGYNIVGPDGLIAMMQHHPAKQDRAAADARRIVACVNACDGIPVEKLEGRTLAEYVASEAYITGMHEGTLGLVGEGPAVLASSVAGFFHGSGAENYVELRLQHPADGEFVLTMQKVDRRTPHELRRAAEAERDTLRAAISSIRARVESAPSFGMARDVARIVDSALAEVPNV